MKQSLIGSFFKKAVPSLPSHDNEEGPLDRNVKADQPDPPSPTTYSQSAKRKADEAAAIGATPKRISKRSTKDTMGAKKKAQAQRRIEESSEDEEKDPRNIQKSPENNEDNQRRIEESSEDEEDYCEYVRPTTSAQIPASCSLSDGEGDVVGQEESDSDADESTSDEGLVDEESVEHSDDEPESIAIAAIPPKKKAKKKVAGAKSKAKAKSGDVFPPYHPLRDSEWPAGPDLPYLHLSRLFEEVEKESRRIPNLNRITNFFRSVIAKNPESLLSVVYLCINKLGPDYEGLENGVGDQLLIKVLAQSTGRNIKQVQAELKEVGDLGAIAEKSRSLQQTIFPPPPLSVTKVFAQFRKIANESKADRKIGLIKNLLVSSRESEARYIIRSFQGALRIGCSIRTILPALSRAVVLTPPLSETERKDINSLPDDRLDRSLILFDGQYVAEVEAAAAAIKRTWVECPNMSRIIPNILSHPISELNQHCFLCPGIPIKCMLAAPAKSVVEVLENFESHDIVLEYKYDGERVQIHVQEDGSVQVFSRNAETTTDKFPDIVAMIGKTFKSGQVQSCIIDAEAVAFDRVDGKIRPFQVLSTRKRKEVTTDDISVDICVFAFDLIFLNGKSLLATPLRERRRLLSSSFNEIDHHFRFTISKETSDESEMTTFLEESILQNCEGLMVKCLDGGSQLALYEPDKRSHAWRKLKKDYMKGLSDSFDLVPIGAYYGKGKRTGTFGGYLLAAYDPESEELQSICKIGTGFSDEMLQTLTDYSNEHLLEVPRSYYQYGERDLPDEWLDGSQVWEVLAADLSISPVYKAGIGLVAPDKGIALRFPRFIQVRPDKKPEDATSGNQIADLYNSQNNRR